MLWLVDWLYLISLQSKVQALQNLFSNWFWTIVNSFPLGTTSFLGHLFMSLELLSWDICSCHKNTIIHHNTWKIICSFINISYVSKLKTVFRLHCKYSLWKGLFLFWARPAKLSWNIDSACLKTLHFLFNLSLGRKVVGHCSKYIWIISKIILFSLKFYYFHMYVGPKNVETVTLIKEDISQALYLFLFSYPCLFHLCKNQVNYNSSLSYQVTWYRDVGSH